MGKPGKTKKKHCKYGAGCYRKNEQHLDEYSHPQDEEIDDEPPQKKSKIDDYFNDGTGKGKTETEDKEENAKASTSKIKETEKEDSENKAESDEDEVEEEPPASPEDVKENIKSKFLVDMPEDFYDFWEFSKSINSKKPEDAFKSSLGLELVGAFDVLAGKCVKKNSKGKRPCYLRHWRYYYDPPEFMTLIKGDDQTQFHIGYFRDDPKEMPAFVASNAAKDSCIITARGENLYAAVNWFIEDQIKKDKSKKAKLEKLQNQLKKHAKNKDYSLDQKTKRMKERDKKSVCKTFHHAGMVVPVDSNGVGYRDVPETPGDLKKMFKAVVEAKTESARDKAMDPLMEILMLIQFANDECDYGEGLEMGLCMFSYGGEVLHGQIMNLLPLGYQLLRRNEYAEIITAHLKDRQHTASLSQLM